MNEQAIRFRLGIFVLAALILLAVLITLFGGFPNYFKKSDNYTIVFTNAQGVGPGTPVRRSGVRIGQVRSLSLDNATGKVNVTIQIDEGFALRKDDRPTLVQTLFGGDAAIAFLPPTEAKEEPVAFVPPGAVLDGITQADTGALLQKAGDLAPPVQEAMVEMKKVFQKFDKMTPLMEDTIKEIREVARVTKQFVPEMAKTNEDLRKLINTVGPELLKTNEEVRELTKATKQVIPEFLKTNDEVRELVKATRQVVPEFLKTNDEVREMVKATRLAIPDFRKTNEEFQLVARNWGKLGERLDVLVQTNEDKLVKTIDRLQDTLKRVGDVFDDQNLKNLRDILKNAEKGSRNLEGLARETEELIKESQKTMKRVNDSLLRGDDILANMQKATKPFAERSDGILRNVEESTEKLNKILAEVREVYQAVTRGEGTIQKLLTDPQLYNNINDTASTINKILPRLDRVLRDVEIFADKIARHPESLGLGGVVRPGTGLKESPSVLPWRPHQ